MGNICDAMGISRREPGKIGFQGDTGIESSGSSTTGGQDRATAVQAVIEQEKYKSVAPTTKSPVISAATANPSAVSTSVPVSPAMNAAELKAAYAKKQSDEAAAAAAALSAPTGPRIRLLPHQHTLFCERKQRVCSAVGQLQEMEVVALEGFQLGTPPFTWIRIAPAEIGKFSEDFEGLIEPAWYAELPPQQLLDERGHRTHPDTEYVLTREDVGYFIGVRYDVEVTVDVVAEEAPANAAHAAAATSSESAAGAGNENKNETDQSSAATAPAVSEATEHMKSAEDLQANVPEVKEEAGASAAPEARKDDTSAAACTQVTRQEVHVVHKFLALTSHGPVKPGPPRLTDFDVTGSMKVGSVAVAEVSYIGGYEGLSEYWWLRISPEGKRTQVTEPRRVPFPSTAERPRSGPEYAVRGVAPAVVTATATVTETASAALIKDDVPTVTEDGLADTENGPVLMAPADASGSAEGDTAAATDATSEAAVACVEAPVAPLVDEALLDPRLYLLTEDDLGCCLKAKCRPTRSDGAQGEIFTSSSSEEVTA